MSNSKIIFIDIFIVIWFIHLLLSIGGGYAALRLWGYRDNSVLISRLLLYLIAFGIECVELIVLIFLGHNVVFTWKFSVALFCFLILKDALRIPLIWYIIKGFK